MSYIFKQDLIPASKYSIKSPYLMTPQYITIHNTSNSASAENEIKYMKNNNNATSFHVCVDEKYVIQAIPFTRNAWHAGDGASGKGNRHSIGIEIARSTGDINLFKQAEKNCAKYVAVLLKQYGWGIERVKRHFDWSRKYCPHKTLELGWSRFLNMVKIELNILKAKGNVATTEAMKATNTSSICVNDKVKVNSNATTYANSTKTIPSWVKNGTYTVSKVNGSKVLLKEIVSWVYTKDITRIGASYLVKVTVDSLNIRSGAGVNHKVVGTVRKGEIYTIVEEKNGFGKLKSGKGWISLDCTQKK